MSQHRVVEVVRLIFHLSSKTNQILFQCKSSNHLRTKSVLAKVAYLEVAHLIVLNKGNQAHASKVCNQIRNQIKSLISSNHQVIIDFIILLIKRIRPKLRKKHSHQNNLIKIIYNIRFQLMLDCKDKVRRNL